MAAFDDASARSKVGGGKAKESGGDKFEELQKKLADKKEAALPDLDVDGEWGPKTTKALQEALGIDGAGKFGEKTTKALQKKLGVTADGIFGPESKKALQKYLGVTVDGVVGPQTVKAMQKKLNAGTF